MQCSARTLNTRTRTRLYVCMYVCMYVPTGTRVGTYVTRVYVRTLLHSWESVVLGAARCLVEHGAYYDVITATSHLTK